LFLFRPVGRISQQGAPETTRGATFFDTIFDICSNQGTKHEMGGQILNGGQGTTGPHWRRPCFHCTNTGLFWCAIWVYLKSLNGSPACDFWTQTS